MNRRTSVSLAAFALTALAFGPCAKDRLSDDEFLFAAQATASASVLRVENMPAGWDSEPVEPASLAGEGESGFTGQCVPFSTDGWPGETAYSGSEVLIGPTHEIRSTASVFRHAGKANDTLDEFFELVDTCSDQVLLLAQRQADFGPGDEFNSTLLDIGDLGDDARGIRIEGTADGERFVADLVYVRHGRIIVTFAYRGSVPADDERNWFTAVQMGKARVADAALPD